MKNKKMNRFRRLLFCVAIAGISSTSFAQSSFDDSGIAAGFFDSSQEKTINFSEFHLPPLAVLFENAKSTPQVMSLQKAQEIAEAEVAKQRRHNFSYIQGHASYSYGVSDAWGQSSSSYYTLQLMQFTGNEQSYWNVGVNLAVPVEDILDLGAAVKRKKMMVDQAIFNKDLEYDKLKLQIATLYTKITTGLVQLKTASENAAIYQGAGALNLEDFHQGNMSIEDYAWTKMHELGNVQSYQAMQTTITTDIITLEILSHTPILTNTTTEITLDSGDQKTEKQIRKENKAIDKQIRKTAAAEEKRYAEMEKAERKAQEKAAKLAKKAEKKN